MFSRAAKSGHVCLRCQLRLRAPDRLLSKTPFLDAATNPRRYQSVAAAQVDDEDVSPTPSPSYTSTHPAPIKKDAAAKKSWKKRLSKTWRPRQTAELGMNALGKPSEVLLLAPRDRKIPLVPKESTEESKESFYESVASEKQPATWEHVKENISHARQQIEQRQGPLTPEAWANFKKVMVSGFTQKQLRRYLEEATSPETRVKKPQKMMGKDLIIKLIAKHIWKYELPAQQIKGAQQVEESVLDTTLRLPPCSKEQQVVIDRDPITSLRKRANQYDVKMIFDKKRTVLSGPAEHVAEIRASLQEQLSGTRKAPRVIDGYARLLRDPKDKENIQILVETLAQKYGLNATATERKKALQLSILCPASNASSADRLKHELRLELEREAGRLPCVTNITKSQRLVLLPDYFPGATSTYPFPKALHRARPMKASNKDVPLEPISEIVHEKLVINPQSTKKSSHQQIEYMAELGAVLFNDVNMSSISPDGFLSGDSAFKDMRSTFHPQIPALPHLLTSQSLQQAKPTESSTFTARLCFTPLDSESSAQVIEVELLGDDIRNGLGQDLRVHRISMIGKENGLHFLQPALPVDIKLSCRHRINLYDSASSQPSELHDAILSYLDGRLKPSDEEESAPAHVPAPSFPLFWDLPSSSDFVGQSSSKSKPQETSSEAAAKPKKSCQYFVSDFSIMDADYYEFEHKTNRYTLEHIYYTAQNPNVNLRNPRQTFSMPSPFRDQQALRIRCDHSPAADGAETAAKATKRKGAKAGESSKKGHPSEKAEFDLFLSAAISVAKQIGKEGNALKQRMLRVK